jgi:hypothetical protein
VATILKNKTCLICRKKTLVKYLDLGNTALANAFLRKKDLAKKEARYPLQVFYCKNCHLAQLGTIVDRKILFENYAWFSSASPQLEEYFQDYAKNVSKRFPKQTRQLVLEIASNDGILLKYFKKGGCTNFRY